MNTKPVSLPYGLWPSPISAARIARRLRLEDARWTPDGQTLVWLEGRSGSGTLVARNGCDAPRDLTEEHSPHGGVGYGGGAFALGNDALQKDCPILVFAERDGRLYRLGLQYDRPSAITPAFGSVASPALSPDGRWAAFVYSDGHTDLLGLVPIDGSEWPAQLARGADFYMQPAWHPTGEWLAWVEWNHPNMPWDATRIQLAQVASGEDGGLPHLSSVQTVGGGDQIPASQPLFSPDGRWLSFIEESGEWPALVLLDLQTKERRVLLSADGFELSQPAWVQGGHSYGWSQSSKNLFYLRYQGTTASLWSINLENGQSKPIDLAPYTWIDQLSVSPTQDELAFLASAPTLPERLLRWNASLAEPERLQIAARSGAETIDPDSLSTPREISWLSEDGTRVFALYYPPHLPGYTGDGLPPAILNIHGGPTSLASTRFSGESAYFTSRGYAWVEVNYRGSSGYGKTYRNALRQHWGEVDVEDAAGCARALADQNLADPQRLVIRGGSAGGYTVLNALIHYPGVFKAGVCLYGVSNLFTLDMDTHKFEERYNASMVGELPEAAGRYRAWSPVFHADKIRDALYIFQGDQDKVVPPSQSEEIAAALKDSGVPLKYKVLRRGRAWFSQERNHRRLLERNRTLLTAVRAV